MKKILIVSCLILWSCGSKKTTPMVAVLRDDCPKNANCSVELFPHKTMVVKTDEFGRTYYVLDDSADKIVVKYTFSRIVKGNVQDGGYREEVVFETNETNRNLSQTDTALQQSKMLFGRFCFCKGQTGYYKVNSGNLTISGSKEKVVSLRFTVDEVPQIINNISFTLK